MLLPSARWWSKPPVRATLDHAPLRQPLYGLHVHTSFSFDAAANSIGATPADAHRFARGDAIDFWPLDETFIDTALVHGERVIQEISMVTEECDGGVGEFGMPGAGCVDATDFVRSALAVGVREPQATGLNPVKPGIIAATDTSGAPSESR